MIISHRHRYIFLKSKKTAGTSIEIALSRSCGPDDVVTALPDKDEVLRREAGGVARQHNTAPPLRVSVHEHSPASRARKALGREVYESYYRFVVERNPWDAVVSLYYWVNRHDGRLGFDEFLHRHEVSNLAEQNFRAWHIGGRPAVDRVLRYERLHDDLAETWAHLGLPGEPELPRAKGGIRPPERDYRSMYDAAGRDHVAQLFASVIEELGYRFDGD